jgi:hypothetical protein
LENKQCEFCVGECIGWKRGGDERRPSPPRRQTKKTHHPLPSRHWLFSFLNNISIFPSHPLALSRFIWYGQMGNAALFQDSWSPSYKRSEPPGWPAVDGQRQRPSRVPSPVNIFRSRRVAPALARAARPVHVRPVRRTPGPWAIPRRCAMIVGQCSRGQTITRTTNGTDIGSKQECCLYRSGVSGCRFSAKRTRRAGTYLRPLIWRLCMFRGNSCSFRHPTCTTNSLIFAVRGRSWGKLFDGGLSTDASLVDHDGDDVDTSHKNHIRLASVSIGWLRSA